MGVSPAAVQPRMMLCPAPCCRYYFKSISNAKESTTLKGNLQCESSPRTPAPPAPPLYSLHPPARPAPPCTSSCSSCQNRRSYSAASDPHQILSSRLRAWATTTHCHRGFFFSFFFFFSFLWLTSIAGRSTRHGPETEFAEETADLPTLEEEMEMSRSQGQPAQGTSARRPQQTRNPRKACLPLSTPPKCVMATGRQVLVWCRRACGCRAWAGMNQRQQPGRRSSSSLLAWSSMPRLGFQHTGLMGLIPPQPPLPLTAGAATGGGNPDAMFHRRSINTFQSPDDMRGVIHGREDLEQLSANTWAGETAQVNARRLRALMSLKAQSTSQATPSMNKAPSMFQRQESRIDPSHLLPGSGAWLSSGSPSAQAFHVSSCSLGLSLPLLSFSL